MKIVAFEQDFLHEDMPKGNLDIEYIANWITGGDTKWESTEWKLDTDENGYEIIVITHTPKDSRLPLAVWYEEYVVTEELDDTRNGIRIMQAFNEDGESTKFIGYMDRTETC